MSVYYTIYLDVEGQYRWNAKGNNHEPIGSGESYPRKADCLHAVSLMNGNNNYPIHDLTLQPNPFLVGLAAPSHPATLGVNPLLSTGLLSAPLPKRATGLIGSVIEPKAPAGNGLLSAILAHGTLTAK